MSKFGIEGYLLAWRPLSGLLLGSMVVVWGPRLLLLFDEKWLKILQGNV